MPEPADDQPPKPPPLDYAPVGGEGHTPLPIKAIIGLAIVVHAFGIIPAAMLVYHALADSPNTGWWNLLSTSICLLPLLIVAGAYGVLLFFAGDERHGQEDDEF